MNGEVRPPHRLIAQPIRRRTLLAAFGLALAGCASAPSETLSTSSILFPTATPSSPASSTAGASSAHKIAKDYLSYGDDPMQYGVFVHSAATQLRGVVALLHGGFWRSEWGSTKDTDLIAEDLARRGYHVWNLEYRGIDTGGGWPSTFQDVAAGVDHLSTMTDTDLSHVVYMGHSAGGQLAIWAASRKTLPDGAPGAGPKVQPVGAISLGGELDLTTLAGSGEEEAIALMNGSPSQVPDNYRLGDPTLRVPLGVPSVAVHSRTDEVVPFSYSETFVAAAVAAGDQAVLLEVEGTHYDVIDANSKAWQSVIGALDQLVLPS